MDHIPTVHPSGAPPRRVRPRAQLRSETVPTTPSKKRHWTSTLASDGPQATSAPEMRTGYRTSNATPRSHQSNIATSKLSEGRSSLDPQIQRQLTNKIIEVETDAFLKAVLYKGAATRKKADEDRADKCLRNLGPLHERSAQRPIIHPSTGPYSLPPISEVPTYENGFPQLLLRKARREEDVYPLLVSLLNYVRCFFCNDIKDVDAHWSSAQEPTIPTATQDAGPPLSRVFRDTHAEPRSYSRNKHGQGELKPDICLLIEPAGKRKTTTTCENTLKPTEVENTSTRKAHWQDVTVVVEVKKRGFDMKTLVQVANYARAMMVEQKDRNFVFTVLITGDECRVFRWDAVGAQVTEAINFHQNPKLFLQVMGRLATMTPSELGYDTHFSNAGRVLSTETIKTHLTIHRTEPRQYFTHDPAPLTPPDCPEALPPLILELEKLQFESKGLLFGRATRVWKAVSVEPPGVHYIVKQNWADDSRPNEGFFHTLTTGVAAVPNLETMEECEFTSFFRARDGVKGVLPLVAVNRVEKLALKRQPLFGGGTSRTDDHASTDVHDAGVSAESECMSDDDMDGDAASDEDDGADGNTGVGGEEDVGDNEDVADQKGASQVKGDENANGASRPSLERVLVRFVFEGEGRPLSHAKDSIELLQATVQWIKGLMDLNGVGIVHRDISYGNLLLPSPKEGEPPQARIIDLGLSHLMKDIKQSAGNEPHHSSGPHHPFEPDHPSDPDHAPDSGRSSELEQSSEPDHSSPNPNSPAVGSSQPHHPLTGTLPFVAHELLQDPPINHHALHHDVESVFWVLLYVCARADGASRRFRENLLTLFDPNITAVKHTKGNCLNDPAQLKNIGGKFKDLEGFVTGFTQTWRDCAGNRTEMPSKVLALAQSQLSLLELRRTQLEEAEAAKAAKAKSKRSHPGSSKAKKAKKAKQETPSGR
ncbi:hypothetical protein M407DRAFT_34416 [Tulasnella calospora MUT 4182]|uniref:Protein kinase domain-containing protein n=1 Tax=Tulasnella calospora MUT 4182 TaxID=1051891 RepID=A0A0C3Q1B7_9AGAM|nr:hypothetical protein M407DRAFT_34416 [Tulasnella calospora MUT 4182]